MKWLTGFPRRWGRALVVIPRVRAVWGSVLAAMRVQTAIGELAKLTRRHHRIKTPGKWQVEQPFPGILIWRSPHGRMFLVDQTGTRRLTTTA